MKPTLLARGEARRIATAADAWQLLRGGFPCAGTESLRVVHLDRSNRLIAIDRHDGAADRLDVSLRAILIDALAVGTAAVLIAHNHPSGDPTPSMADRTVTGRLATLLAGIEVRLLDHLVFAGARCTSFRQLGLL